MAVTAEPGSVQEQVRDMVASENKTLDDFFSLFPRLNDNHNNGNNDSYTNGGLEITSGVAWTVVAPLVLLSLFFIVGAVLLCIWRLRWRSRGNDPDDDDDNEGDRHEGAVEMTDMVGLHQLGLHLNTQSRGTNLAHDHNSLVTGSLPHASHVMWRKGGGAGGVVSDGEAVSHPDGKVQLSNPHDYSSINPPLHTSHPDKGKPVIHSSTPHIHQLALDGYVNQKSVHFSHQNVYLPMADTRLLADHKTWGTYAGCDGACHCVYCQHFDQPRIPGSHTHQYYQHQKEPPHPLWYPHQCHFHHCAPDLPPVKNGYPDRHHQGPNTAGHTKLKQSDQGQNLYRHNAHGQGHTAQGPVVCNSHAQTQACSVPHLAHRPGSRLSQQRGVENPLFASDNDLDQVSDSFKSVSLSLAEGSTRPTGEEEEDGFADHSNSISRVDGGGGRYVINSTSVMSTIGSSQDAEGDPSRPRTHSTRQRPLQVYKSPLVEGPDVSSIKMFSSVSLAWRQSSRRLPTPRSSTDNTTHTSTSNNDREESVSLPSSISRFHASRARSPVLPPDAVYPLASTYSNMFPASRHHGELGGSLTDGAVDPTRRGQVKVTSCGSLAVSDQFSDNTSMFPNVGSSATSGQASDVRGSQSEPVSVPVRHHPWREPLKPGASSKTPHHRAAAGVKNNQSKQGRAHVHAVNGNTKDGIQGRHIHAPRIPALSQEHNEDYVDMSGIRGLAPDWRTPHRRSSPAQHHDHDHDHDRREQSVSPPLSAAEMKRAKSRQIFQFPSAAKKHGYTPIPSAGHAAPESRYHDCRSPFIMDQDPDLVLQMESDHHEGGRPQKDSEDTEQDGVQQDERQNVGRGRLVGLSKDKRPHLFMTERASLEFRSPGPGARGGAASPKLPIDRVTSGKKPPVPDIGTVQDKGEAEVRKKPPAPRALFQTSATPQEKQPGAPSTKTPSSHTPGAKRQNGRQTRSAAKDRSTGRAKTKEKKPKRHDHVYVNMGGSFADEPHLSDQDKAEEINTTHTDSLEERPANARRKYPNTPHPSTKGRNFAGWRGELHNPSGAFSRAKTDAEILADVFSSFPSDMHSTDTAQGLHTLSSGKSTSGGFIPDATIPSAFADELFGIWTLSPEFDSDLSLSRPRTPLMTPLKEEAKKATSKFIWGVSNPPSASTSTSSFTNVWLTEGDPFLASHGAREGVFEKRPISGAMFPATPFARLTDAPEDPEFDDYVHFDAVSSAKSSMDNAGDSSRGQVGVDSSGGGGGRTAGVGRDREANYEVCSTSSMVIASGSADGESSEASGVAQFNNLNYSRIYNLCGGLDNDDLNNNTISAIDKSNDSDVPPDQTPQQLAIATATTTLVIDPELTPTDGTPVLDKKKYWL